MATASDSTIPLALRARVMRRAWEIFRTNYHYPTVPFRSIGKACFTYALKLAWIEAKQIVRLAALGKAKIERAIAHHALPKGRIGIETLFWERAEDMIERHWQVALFTAARDYAVAP